MTGRTIITRILAGLNLLIWGFFLLMGLALQGDVEARIAPSRPDPVQVAYYVGFPAVMALLAVGVFLWLLFGKPGEHPALRNVARFVVGASLLVFLPYMFVYTGGV